MAAMLAAADGNYLLTAGSVRPAHGRPASQD
jgi:hypothetical protein